MKIPLFIEIQKGLLFSDYHGEELCFSRTLFKNLQDTIDKTITFRYNFFRIITISGRKIPMKRLLSVFLVLILIISVFGTAHASSASITSTELDTMMPLAEQDPPFPFTDVSEESWYYDFVQFVYENKLMNGMSSTKFEPTGSLTRAQIVTVLYRLSGSPEVRAGTAFTDLSKTEYYYPAILWAEQNGIAKGMTETTFEPVREVSRQQIAAFLYRYVANYLGEDVSSTADLSQYLDQASIHPYARDAFQWTVDVGLIIGFESDDGFRLKPADTTTRGQIAALLFRLWNLGYDFTGNGDTGNGEEGKASQSSEEIIDFIKVREGFTAKPYWDHSQWTVGYGTCCRTEDGQRVTRYEDYDQIADRYKNLTEEDAELLLKESLAEDYEVSVTRYAEKHGLEFTQGEFDALVSFTFNLGALWTSGGYIINDCLENPDTTDLELVQGMGVWCRVSGSVSPGTCERRLREAAIFLYDDYTGDGEHTNFHFVRFKGNGSLLTSRYTDDVAYFTAGNCYGELPAPVWNPSANSTNDEKAPSFVGWFTSDGTEVTAETLVEENLTLTAKWAKGTEN